MINIKQRVFVICFLIILLVFCPTSCAKSKTDVDTIETTEDSLDRNAENGTPKYIVVSNNVNVRDGNSLNAKIIRRISFPEIIDIYEIKGSGNMRNGVLDKWVRISKDTSEWINYYYITSFPFVVSSRKEYYYGPDDYDVIIIKDYYTENGTVYFNVEKMLNSYYHNDIEYKSIAKDEIQGISLIDNPWTRLYNFCDNFAENINKIDPRIEQTWNVEIENETMVMDYGIHVGMNWDNVVEILGTSYNQEGLNWYNHEGTINSYAAMYIGYGHWLSFSVVNNKVVKIKYLIEK
jgi:hypothetical protein